MMDDRKAFQTGGRNGGKLAHGVYWQSARYVIVGGVSFLIYFGLLGLMFGVLHTPYPVAVGIAYVLAVGVHFLANRTFTFRAADASVTMQLGRYFGLLLLNYGIQISILYVVYDICGLDFYLGAVSGVLVTLITGFLLMRTWVFAGTAGLVRRDLLCTSSRGNEPTTIGKE